MSSVSSNEKLTVVQLDLVNSSMSFQYIYTKLTLGDDTVAKFVKQIEEIVSQAFNQSVEHQEIKPHLTKIETSMADGYRLTFESVENAYDFVKIFCQSVDERNKKPGIDQWSFRIGAATGNIDYDPSRLNQMVANVLMVVKELETGAFPGWLFIDDATYNGLSQDIQNKFSQQNFTKKHQQQKNAWGCPMLVNSDMEPLKPIIWSDKNKDQLITNLTKVFTEKELKAICTKNNEKLNGNPYDQIEGDTSNQRSIYLIDYLIRKGYIDVFLNILKKENSNFDLLVESLRG